TASRPSSADRVPAPNNDSGSWFSRFLARTFSAEPKQSSISAFSPEPQQDAIFDKPNTVTRTTSPRHPKTDKTASREQPRIEQPSTTNGLAGAARPDQPLPQGTSEKDGKPSRQLTAAERQTLFEDFLNWYMEKSVFGKP